MKNAWLPYGLFFVIGGLFTALILPIVSFNQPIKPIIIWLAIAGTMETILGLYVLYTKNSNWRIRY